MNDPSPFTLLAFMLATAKRRGVDWRSITGTSNQSDYLVALRRQPHVLPHRAARRAAHPRSTTSTSATGTCRAGTRCRSSASTCSRPARRRPRRWRSRSRSAIQYAEDCIAARHVAGRRSCRASRSSSTSRSRSSRRSPSSAPAAASGRASRASARRAGPALVALQVPRQTSGVDLTRQQPLNNIARVTVQAMAGIFGGLQSLHTDAYDEALSCPTRVRRAHRGGHAEHPARGGAPDRRHRPARRLLLRRDADQRDGGRASCASMDDGRRAGRHVQAVESGIVQQRIGESARRFQERVDSGEQTVVGVNAYQVDEDAQRAPGAAEAGPGADAARTSRASRTGRRALGSDAVRKRARRPRARRASDAGGQHLRPRGRGGRGRLHARRDLRHAAARAGLRPPAGGGVSAGHRAAASRARGRCAAGGRAARRDRAGDRARHRARDHARSRTARPRAPRSSARASRAAPRPRARRRHHRRAGRGQVDADQRAAGRARSRAASASPSSPSIRRARSPAAPCSATACGWASTARTSASSSARSPRAATRAACRARRGAVVDLLDAAGFDTVIVETVGAGQSDVEIASLADTQHRRLPARTRRRRAGDQGRHPGDRRHARRQQGRPAGRRRHRARLKEMLRLRARRSARGACRCCKTAATRGDGIAAVVDAVARARGRSRARPPAARPRRVPSADEIAAVDRAITSRRSVRAFLPDAGAARDDRGDPAVARRAPSGTNTQPWQRARRDRRSARRALSRSGRCTRTTRRARDAHARNTPTTRRNGSRPSSAAGARSAGTSTGCSASSAATRPACTASTGATTHSSTRRSG